jgi:histidine triad (HIT) family protein
MTTYAEGEATEAGCLFCRIVRGEVPSDPVLTTEHTYAFRDIQPAAPVHVLVVPKRHIGHAGEVGADDGSLLAEVVVAARQVAEQEGIGERGYRLVFNVGEDAQNSVPHLHLHVLGGRRLGWPPG